MPGTTLVSSSLIEAVHDARARTDAHFSLLQPSALYQRPIPERHRLIFYLGHLEAFDWNQIGRSALGLRSFHPEFDKLFEFGIDPPPGQAAADQPSDWPTQAQVLEYNRLTRQTLDRVLDQAPEQILHIALEHRLMHAETLAYLFHNLPYDAKLAPPDLELAPAPGPVPVMISIPAGSTILGQSPDCFGWDNEFNRHQVEVHPFRMAKYKVTNGQYLEFVRAGVPAPHFWVERDGQWFYRGMFAEVPLPLDWPVYVTHDEASAYAKWAGKSLPTEAQFHRAAYTGEDDNTAPYPWGGALPSPLHGNFDFHRWDPAPVTADPAGDSVFGVAQLVGNGWEWTSTAFAPFEGFQPSPSYPGYSQNFFDGQHFVLKGASPRTAACFLRRSYRNWFRPNYPYVYATFRVVEN
ncbi:MAG: SUMF1/EgtB/PvdO family nonheme iron enzyme [Acidobacteriota bacterium]|nr:SUMF1/EgtB/PvdO family nonheme iron enzyme [Acidobacteriota bacterium]